VRSPDVQLGGQHALNLVVAGCTARSNHRAVAAARNLTRWNFARCQNSSTQQLARSSKGGQNGHHNSSDHYPSGAAPWRWRLVWPRALVLGVALRWNDQELEINCRLLCDRVVGKPCYRPRWRWFWSDAWSAECWPTISRGWGKGCRRVRVAAPMDPRRPRTPRVAAGPGLLLMHFKRRK